MNWEFTEKLTLQSCQYKLTQSDTLYRKEREHCSIRRISAKEQNSSVPFIARQIHKNMPLTTNIPMLGPVLVYTTAPFTPPI